MSAAVIVVLGWATTTLVLISYSQSSSARLRIVSVAASIIAVVHAWLLKMWPTVSLEISLVAINGVRLALPKRNITPGTLHRIGSAVAHESGSLRSEFAARAINEYDLDPGCAA